METKHYQIYIDATPEEVYTKMLDTKNFETWTAVFNPTSKLEGNWTIGSTMHFIATEPDGTVCGMLSRILENTLGKSLIMEHYGTVLNGKEILDGDAAKALEGLREEYIYNKTDTGTRLEIKTDLLDEWVDFMEEKYPQALIVLKSICED